MLKIRKSSKLAALINGLVASKSDDKASKLLLTQFCNGLEFGAKSVATKQS